MPYFKINQPISYWKADLPRLTKYSKISDEFETIEAAIDALRIQTETIVTDLKKQGYECQPGSYSVEEN